MPPMKMAHVADPAKDILDKIGMKTLGVIDGFHLHGNRVLVGIYQRPEKTKSGIFLADQTREEDKYQGKAALVLMLGTTAFQDDDYFKFNGDAVAAGDWVALFVADGRRISINGQDCRVLRDQDITMRIPAPDSVY